MSEPLKGIRVLDLSRVLAGPYCTMMLGDAGAEVIKVERPNVGDETRAWGPPFVNGESAYFICCNRNKKSITINLKSEKGIKLIKQLARISDVLVENFPPGTTENFGIDYENIKKENAQIIYCSITGLGADGPSKDLTGYDLVIQGYGGLMSITGEEGGEPVKVGVALVDVITGIQTYGAIVTALYVRNKTGCGQKIDTSLLEAEVASLVNIGSSYLVGNVTPKKYGSAHESIVPYQAFKAKDKYITIAVGNDGIWKRFCEVIGRLDLCQHPKFATNPDRVKNRKELISILKPIIESKTAKEWLELFKKAAVPAGPLNTIPEVFTDPQVLHRNMVVEVDHPTAGKIKLAGIPVKFSETKLTVRTAPPLLGQHTEEILQGLLGISKEEIMTLKKENVI